MVEQVASGKDTTPKALACYGILLRHCPIQTAQWAEQIWLRFVEGRPISDITIQFLDWCCEKLAQMGKRVLILVWDNARWHSSRAVHSWIRDHNRAWDAHLCLSAADQEPLAQLFVLPCHANAKNISLSPKMSPDYALITNGADLNIFTGPTVEEIAEE